MSASTRGPEYGTLVVEQGPAETGSATCSVQGPIGEGGAAIEFKPRRTLALFSVFRLDRMGDSFRETQ